MNNKIECYNCEEEFNESDLIYLDTYDRYVCSECLSNYYYKCDNCEDYVEEDSVTNVNNGDLYYCECCLDDYAYYCEECNNYFTEDRTIRNEDDDNYYCDECYHRLFGDENIIKEYHHRDIPLTYKYLDSEITEDISVNDLLYFGIELEVQNKKDNITNNKMASMIRDKFRHLDLVFERDGSVYNGFEIITQPMTMDYIKEHKNDFKDMLALLDNNGFASHNTSCCGLHIHFSRNYFKDNEDKYLQKLVLFFEQNKDQLQNFSRRKDFNWCRWVTDYCDIDNKYKNVGLYIKDSMKRNASHNIAINTGNASTIEIRIFKGTLKYETYMASVELVDSLVRAIKNKSNSKISFNNVINDKSNEFIQDYCTNRGISNNATIIDNTTQVFKEIKSKMKELDNIDKSSEIITKDIIDNIEQLVVKYTGKMKTRNKYNNNIINLLYSLNTILINNSDYYNKTNNIKIKKQDIYDFNNYYKYFTNSRTHYYPNLDRLSLILDKLNSTIIYSNIKDNKIIKLLNKLNSEYKEKFNKLKSSYDNLLNTNNGGEE